MRDQAISWRGQGQNLVNSKEGKYYLKVLLESITSIHQRHSSKCETIHFAIAYSPLRKRV